MTTKQLSAAMTMAQDMKVRFINDEGQHLVDISVFDGFGLENFKPVVVTLRQLAALIRWQCFCFNGDIDSDNLNEIARVGRRKFTVVGD